MTDDEIKEAWAAMHGWQFCSDERGRWWHVYEKALDALAREPATEAVLHRKNVRIGVLEARLARVREALDDCVCMLENVRDDAGDPEGAIARQVEDAHAALAACATEVKP